MAGVKIHSNHTNPVTCIPNAFIDHFMKDANGEYVKVYLYLLRCLGDRSKDLSIQSIADHLDLTEKDVRRALTYWEKVGLVRLEFNENRQMTGICVLELQAEEEIQTNVPSSPLARQRQLQAEAQRNTESRAASASMHGMTDTAPGHISQIQMSTVGTFAPEKPSDKFSDKSSRPQYSPEQLAAFKADEDVHAMMFEVESYMKRTLSITDMNTILFWADGLDFSPELIGYLVQSCVDRGHNSIHYMDTVAMSWADKGIHSVADAKGETNTHSQVYYAIMKAFGISGRNLNDKELSYIDKWTHAYGFTIEIISEACTRTVSNLSRPSFPYADSILKRWNEAGVHKLEDIAPLDQAHAENKRQQSEKKQDNNTDKNKFHNFAHGDYDMDAIEQAMLRN